MAHTAVQEKTSDDLAVSTVWSSNPDCISSLFLVSLFNTLPFISTCFCSRFLSFLHHSCLSFISCSPLISFTCIILRFISCLRLSPSLCKIFIFLENSSVHSILSRFMALHLVSVLLLFSPSFCLHFLTFWRRNYFFNFSTPCI